jgi:GNAT superfamily N-acetyltransferase
VTAAAQSDDAVLRLVDEAYGGPVARRLIEAVQLEYVGLYGGPDDSPVEPEEFNPPAGVFLVGYLGETPVATGGLRWRSDPGSADIEIKRMYVVPPFRGRGLSRQMLAGLEVRAGELGANRIVLETGLRQPTAIALYESSGYTPIPGFGHYQNSPMSCSFAKRVARPDGR